MPRYLCCNSFIFFFIITTFTVHINMLILLIQYMQVFTLYPLIFFLLHESFHISYTHKHKLIHSLTLTLSQSHPLLTADELATECVICMDCVGKTKDGTVMY